MSRTVGATVQEHDNLSPLFFLTLDTAPKAEHGHLLICDFGCPSSVSRLQNSRLSPHAAVRFLGRSSRNCVCIPLVTAQTMQELNPTMAVDRAFDYSKWDHIDVSAVLPKLSPFFRG